MAKHRCENIALCVHHFCWRFFADVFLPTLFRRVKITSHAAYSFIKIVHLRKDPQIAGMPTIPFGVLVCLYVGFTAADKV